MSANCNTPRSCSVPGCSKLQDSRGYCKSHYYRWSRYGDPLGTKPPRLTRPTSERFWEKVDKLHPSGCWLWTAATNGDGYGTFHLGGGDPMVGAHRFAYEALRGPIPPEMELDHLCRNRLCVNPDHIELVTTQENIRRGHGGQHQAMKTHCPRGHPYDLINTRFYKGRRFCRQCNVNRL
jgi:hypothetical protein